MQLFKKIFISGTLELLSGLHIGDSKETVDIGGVDSPVVRRKDNNQPYIPGSSLKGKMRSLLEITHGQPDTFRQPKHVIGRFFGAISNNSDGIPSRLIVRDASMNEESATKLYKSEFTDMPYSEIKFENVIDRIRGVAEHPRQIERVPAGTKFDVSFIVNIIAIDAAEADDLEKSYLQLFWSGIRLLEDDYLGGSGSRGYGQIKFDLKESISKTKEDYLNGK
jgi:CRISPR-associated protein Csm3